MGDDESDGLEREGEGGVVLVLKVGGLPGRGLVGGGGGGWVW